MAGRSGPIATVGKILFATPFVGFGLAALGLGGKLLLAGGLEGLFSVAFGLVFAGAGVWQIVSALRETRSAEELAARTKPTVAGVSDVLPARAGATGYRVSAGAGPTARDVYASALESAPLPKIVARPGTALAWALGLAQKSMIGDVVMALFWNVLTWPMFLAAVGGADVFPALLMSIFVAVGAWLAARVLRRWLGRRKLYRVEIDSEPAWLGDEVSLYVEQSGPAKIVAYRVNLICREVAKYTVGTKTRTETNDVLDLSLVEEFGIRLGFGERWTRQLSVSLPASAPPSFAADNNQVDWLVRVQAEIEGWPDYDESFAFRALPRLGS